jgi:hypothetical protein
MSTLHLAESGENPQEKIRGWKGIADALSDGNDTVSEQTARRWAQPTMPFRLPVRHDHLGVYITRWNIARWREDQDRPYGLHIETKVKKAG